jgi:asparagine synthase (glutamine-hydrolysing)
MRLMDADLGLADLDPGSHVLLDLTETGETASGQPAPDDVLSLLEIENYLPNTLLRDADVMSMAHGVEVRVPLCDHVLIEAVLAAGSRARVRRGRKKPLLADAVRHPLMASTERRRKRGFVLPIGRWLAQDLREQVDGVLRDAALCSAVGLVPARVSGLWQRYLAAGAGGAGGGQAQRAAWRLWALFTLLSWARLQKARL